MTIARNVELKVNKLTLYTTEGTIFRDISLTLRPNTMVALLGPSGAGKSTLLNSLAGRISDGMVVTGDILVNGNERSENRWMHQSGYVEQDFYAYDNQTVYETLYFYYILKRNSTSLTNIITNDLSGTFDIDEKIRELLNILNLNSSSSLLMKKLSGGERKRVSIGIELIDNPEILFIDEPTSGLDSFNAINILATLSNLKKLSTILITIHQPSCEMMKYFDGMVLMSQGDLIFEGKYVECVDFFRNTGFECPDNVIASTFFLDSVSLNTTSDELKRASIEKIKKLRDSWARHKVDCMESLSKTDSIISDSTYIEPEAARNVNLASWLISFRIILRRNFSNYLRNTQYIKSQIVQRAVFILLIGLTYFNMGYSQKDIQSRVGVIFFMLMNSMFGVVGPIFNVYAKEKRIINRERASGYYDGYALYFSAVIVEFVFVSFFNLVYISSVYWMTQLNPSFGRFIIFLLIQLCLLFFAVSFGYTVSALTKSEDTAQIVGSTFIIVFILYGGSLNNPKTIPKWLRWLIWLSPVNYAFKAMMNTLFTDLKFEGNNGRGLKTGQDIINFYGADGIKVVFSFFILLGFSLICVFIGAISLHRKTNLKLKLNNIGG